MVGFLVQIPLDLDHRDDEVQFGALGRGNSFQGVVHGKGILTPAFDNIIEDALSLVVIRPQGAMVPAVEEIVLPIEQVQFEHEVLGNMTLFCSM